MSRKRKYARDPFKGSVWGAKGRDRKRARTYSSYRPRSYGYGSPLESKFLDSTKDQATVSQTGNITTSINLIPQGNTESTRVGRKVILTKVNATFTVNLDQEQDQADIGGGDIVRVIIYCDKQANGAVPVVLDILETAVYDSYRNLANATRFKILHDRMITINRRVAVIDGTNTSTSPLVFASPWKVNLNMRTPLEFNSTAGAITELTTNNLGFLYIARNATAGIASNVRIRFTG